MGDLFIAVRNGNLDHASAIENETEHVAEKKDCTLHYHMSNFHQSEMFNS